MKWAVLGGGLTGIVLARLLREQGEEVIVLEKERTIGGLCRSKTESGFTFDIGGSHIIFSRDAEVLDFMKEVLGHNKDDRTRNTKIFYKGAYVKYPFENGLSQLPKEDCFFCINEFIRTLIASERGELALPANFKEWIYTTFGRGIAELYMVPYNEKIWKYPSEKMSLHWVEGRIPRPPVEDVIRSAIGIETEGYTHQAVFSYPIDGGIEALIRALAEPVNDATVTGFQVTSIEGSPGNYRISDGKRTITADQVVSTIPLQALLPCLEGVPGDVEGAVRGLRYNSLVCVGIGLKGNVDTFSWLYIPQKELGEFNRISFPSNYSTRVTPDGHASILAEITYNQGDAIDTMDDGEVAAHVISGLTDMGIITVDHDVAYTTVERQKFAYVVYDLEYQSHIEIIRNHFKDREIHLVGRFAEFEYLNMDGCIRRAMDFVREHV